jgi:hypothetical protein
MDIATAIFGCLLSKWHLVTRLLGLGLFVMVQNAYVVYRERPVLNLGPPHFYVTTSETCRRAGNANRGYDLRLIQDYLGHRDPKHTVHYTRIAGSRFEGLWR